MVVVEVGVVVLVGFDDVEIFFFGVVGGLGLGNEVEG